MAQAFNLPEIGEGVVEGEIVEWHVSAGDQVAVDQQLVSVLTDKATVEIAADFTGTITSVFGGEGDVVAVGARLVEYSLEAVAPEAPPAPKNTGEATAPKASAGQVIDFPLPEIGEGVIEGEIVAWAVAKGDLVVADQVVVSILTDKATVEITAPAAGRVLETSGEAGDMLQVGSVIMKLEAGEGAASSTAAPVSAAPAEAAVTAAPVATASTGEVDPADNPSISSFGTPLATPAVRRFASGKGVDLRRVRGTGPKNRITRADVERALTATPATPPTQAASPAQAAPAAPARPATSAAPTPVAAAPSFAPTAIAASSGDRREKLRGLRKAIHGAMTRSKSIIPHFTYVDEIEMDALVGLRGRLKETAAREGVKLTYLPFIVKAVVMSLKKFPVLNCSVDDAAGEIVYKNHYNLGIATATPNGLTVPVVKEADRKSMFQLAQEIVEVTGRARNLKSTMDDISGGTFTITSLGRLGGLLATPIINHPEVGILGIHNLQERAVVRDGQIVIRNMMNLSLSCDHRVVDGDVAAMFVQEVKAYLEEPGKLMLQMI